MNKETKIAKLWHSEKFQEKTYCPSCLRCCKRWFLRLGSADYTLSFQCLPKIPLSRKSWVWLFLIRRKMHAIWEPRTNFNILDNVPRDFLRRNSEILAYIKPTHLPFIGHCFVFSWKTRICLTPCRKQSFKFGEYFFRTWPS